MKLGKLLGVRVKETPNGANIKSHILMLRAGYIKQISAGIFSLLPPAQRVSLKIQNIIREEMNKIGGQEVLFPVVMPRELWEMSGRYNSIKNEMVRFKDRTGHDMVLGMTHEEAAVYTAMNVVTSHEDLPLMVYQFQTKFRDEPRARGGLIRVREFTMKDAIRSMPRRPIWMLITKRFTMPTSAFTSGLVLKTLLWWKVTTA